MVLRSLIILAVLTSWGSVANGADEQPVLSACGPISVQHILRIHGQPVELVELIAEIQGGDPKIACSIFQLQTALEKRGVHTRLIDVGIFGFVHSHCPAIIHYRRGHFAVVEEVSGLYAKVADVPGVPGGWEPIPSIMYRQSGIALLTSDSTIPLGAIRLKRWPCVAVAVGGLGAVGSWLIRRTFVSMVRTRRSLR